MWVSHEVKKTVVTGIEMFRKYWMKLKQEITLVLLRGIERREVERGQVLAAPGSITLIPISREVYVLTKEREEDILLSSMVIVLSFTLELLMLLERLNS